MHAPTMNLRWVRNPEHHTGATMDVFIVEKLNNPPMPYVLQQAFVDEIGNIEWREIPIAESDAQPMYERPFAIAETENKKGKIIQVGTIENGVPRGWMFDMKDCPNTPGMRGNFDGIYEAGGYTISELWEIINANNRTDGAGC